MKWFKAFFFFFLAVVLAGSMTTRTPAQTNTTGEVLGTVTDPTGAVVADAVVKLTNLSRGSVVETKSSGTGLYTFSLLVPGSYEVRVEAKGFRSYLRNIDVQLGAVSTVNIRVELG